MIKATQSGYFLLKSFCHWYVHSFQNFYGYIFVLALIKVSTSIDFAKSSTTKKIGIILREGKILAIECFETVNNPRME